MFCQHANEVCQHLVFVFIQHRHCVKQEVQRKWCTNVELVCMQIIRRNIRHFVIDFRRIFIQQLAIDFSFQNLGQYCELSIMIMFTIIHVRQFHQLGFNIPIFDVTDMSGYFRYECIVIENRGIVHFNRRLFSRILRICIQIEEFENFRTLQFVVHIECISDTFEVLNFWICEFPTFFIWIVHQCNQTLLGDWTVYAQRFIIKIIGDIFQSVADHCEWRFL